MNDLPPHRRRGQTPKRPRDDASAGTRTGSPLGWLFRNRQTGQITIAQFPNAALWIFLATVALRRVAPNGTAARTAIGGAGVAALGWWALDEVIRGVNPWRRLLGLGAFTFALIALLSLLP